MSKDLQRAFPEVSGFSVQNLKHIRYWYRFYSEGVKGLQLVTQLEMLEKMIKSIPWGHNQRIAYKCKDVKEALFYVQKTIDNGWSRNVLVHQIESGLYERQGKAITNFQVKLPVPQSDLAEQTLKDPYNFDFLTLREEYDEKELSD
jgi:predicted nuclease of restriction endonuclease-like (RecB) superfamily